MAVDLEYFGDYQDNAGFMAFNIECDYTYQNNEIISTKIYKAFFRCFAETDLSVVMVDFGEGLSISGSYNEEDFGLVINKGFCFKNSSNQFILLTNYIDHVEYGVIDKISAITLSHINIGGMISSKTTLTFNTSQTKQYDNVFYYYVTTNIKTFSYNRIITIAPELGLYRDKPVVDGQFTSIENYFKLIKIKHTLGSISQTYYIKYYHEDLEDPDTGSNGGLSSGYDNRHTQCEITAMMLVADAFLHRQGVNDVAIYAQQMIRRSSVPKQGTTKVTLPSINNSNVLSNYARFGLYDVNNSDGTSTTIYPIELLANQYGHYDYNVIDYKNANTNYINFFKGSNNDSHVIEQNYYNYNGATNHFKYGYYRNSDGIISNGYMRDKVYGLNRSLLRIFDKSYRIPLYNDIVGMEAHNITDSGTWNNSEKIIQDVDGRDGYDILISSGHVDVGTTANYDRHPIVEDPNEALIIHFNNTGSYKSLTKCISRRNVGIDIYGSSALSNYGTRQSFNALKYNTFIGFYGHSGAGGQCHITGNGVHQEYSSLPFGYQFECNLTADIPLILKEPLTDTSFAGVVSSDFNVDEQRYYSLVNNYSHSVVKKDDYNEFRAAGWPYSNSHATYVYNSYIKKFQYALPGCIKENHTECLIANTAPDTKTLRKLSDIESLPVDVMKEAGGIAADQGGLRVHAEISGFKIGYCCQATTLEEDTHPYDGTNISPVNPPSSSSTEPDPGVDIGIRD